MTQSSLPITTNTHGEAGDPATSEIQLPIFSFLKGGVDVVAKEGDKFDWEDAAKKVQEQLSEVLNAQNISFLIGSGCSSFLKEGKELGIPTMAPMAATFFSTQNNDDESSYFTETERDHLQNGLGIDLDKEEYTQNLERLMEVLFSAQLALKDGTSQSLINLRNTVTSAVKKVKKHVLTSCSKGVFIDSDNAVLKLYTVEDRVPRL